MRYKIDISNNAVRKQAMLEVSKKKLYSCSDITCYSTCDCEDCIFNLGNELTRTEIMNRVIKDR